MVQCAIAERLGKPPPPNPLQHANNKTTKTHYATKVPNPVQVGRLIEQKRAAKQVAKERAATNNALAISDPTPRKSPRLQTDPGR